MRFLQLPRTIVCGVAAALASQLALSQALELEDGQATLILTNGSIYTVDGQAEAMAIGAKGVILAVGASDLVSQFKGEGTEVRDLQGDTVLPGFHEMHVHPMMAGLRENACKFAQGSSLQQVLDKVAQCVEAAEPGEWITGGQWDAPTLGGIPHRELLDRVAPNNPVILTDTSGHSDWVNTMALEQAGISRDTPDPPGGVIERDSNGDPTGVTRENAQQLIADLVPPPNLAQRKAAVRWSLDTMLAGGITSFVSATTGEAEAEAFAALADDGDLKQRVRLCLGGRREDPKDVESLIQRRQLYARERLSPDCVKLYLDGVPTDSHTGAMLEPYADIVEGRDDEASRKGILMYSDEDVKKVVTDFDVQGLTVKFHAAGDAAVRRGLDAIAAAREANGFSGLLHNVGHCTFVSEEDLPRARAMGATYEVSPYLWAPSPINDSIIAAVGPERIERVWPVRDMIDAGALVVPGSDWSVVPAVNPWIGVETLVTRETLGGGESFGKGQAITVDEALAMYTVNAARQMGHDDRVGRIAPGMIADLVVVNQDPHKVPAQKLHETVVKATIINGEIVYEAGP
ncbi:amidohydrolase [Kineobactrum salinum]|uniref:Amidohydrolase family protein n=1 Tax=Kineobactrum salinum TaxID=2708301 RepID=A0A6C0TZ36_9GAMM|nr:amidohydrolase [Kineobactrum salinum]QIB64918.1 amidohydrolase family protein [Kineobactrum salinum]